MSDIDKSIEKILNNFMMKEEGVISNNPHPYIKAIKQLMADEFKKKIKELNESDWRKPINSDELRQKLEEWKK